MDDNVRIRPNTSGNRIQQPTNMTSWLPETKPEPPAPKGMPATQKERLAVYMDEFRSKNGGCLLTENEKIAEYSAFPEVGADAVRIYLYGLCRDSARQYNSDELAEAKLYEMAGGEEVDPAEAKVVVITLGKDSESRKYY